MIGLRSRAPRTGGPVRLSGALFRSGLLAVWFALAGLLASPLIAPAMMAATSHAGFGPICGAAGSDHGTGDHAPMAECAACICCSPLVALDAPPPPRPLPASIVADAVLPLPPARTPPGSLRAAAYPRGPPVPV